MTRSIRLGTRSSPLALWQANWVADRLRELGAEVELVRITTTGDQRSGPLGAVGGQGLFTKEIQRALLDEQVDLAVHSLKDLPTELVPGLALAAVPPRERCGDALLQPRGQRLAELPQGAHVGTGSMRRQAQLLHRRPDLRVSDIRGNVDTRLRKLDDGEYDAIVLAEAGLTRLGLADRITEVLDKELMLPAVGQGALGLEVREGDAETRAFVGRLDDTATRAAVLAERALLRELRGGCLAPVGAWGRIDEGRLRLDAVVLSRDGVERRHAVASGDPGDAESLGARVAAELLAAGAAELIQGARSG